MNIPIQTDPLPLSLDSDGNIRMSGTRITLENILRWFIQGMHPDEIAEGYPTISRADVYAVIAFYLRHQDEVDDYLAQQQAQCEELFMRIETAQTGKAERLAKVEAIRAKREAERAASPPG